MEKWEIREVEGAEKTINKILNDLEINVEGAVEYLDLERIEAAEKGKRVKANVKFYYKVKEKEMINDEVKESKINVKITGIIKELESLGKELSELENELEYVTDKNKLKEGIVNIQKNEDKSPIIENLDKITQMIVDRRIEVKNIKDRLLI